MLASERQTVFNKSQQSADAWRSKGDAGWERNCLQSALDTLLQIAVIDNESVATGVASLRANGGSATLARVCELNQQFFDELTGAHIEPTKAVSNDVTTVHIAWLLNEWEIARQWLAICMDPRVTSQFRLSKFWREYCRAMNCLSRFEPYEPDVPKVKGYERYWVPYLTFVADIVAGRDTTAAREQIAASFAKRNTDRRLIDWKSHDGDGKQPVKWDFREASIIHFVGCR